MYEEQHPIPQDVTAYQFRLVGDMTLKQFFQIAAGVLVSLFFYSSSLPTYIKWPLILISFLFGLALAFFPVEDRPLSKWIVLFFRSIYAPTIYVWKHTEEKPNYFSPETTQPIAQLPEVQMPNMASSQSAQIAQNIVNQTTEEKKLEKTEEVFLTNVTSQFVNPSVPSTPGEVIAHNMPAPLTASDRDIIQNAQQPSRGLEAIPQTEVVQIEHQDHSNENVVPQTVYKAQEPMDSRPAISQTTNRPLVQGIAATYSSNASPPAASQKPNIVVGQVLNHEGGIVEGAILEIRDSSGRSARALRTNRLGHFMIVTPLPQGIYTITTEKDGQTFDPIQIEANGNIIPPILIQGK